MLSSLFSLSSLWLLWSLWSLWLLLWLFVVVVVVVVVMVVFVVMYDLFQRCGCPIQGSRYRDSKLPIGVAKSFLPTARDLFRKEGHCTALIDFLIFPIFLKKLIKHGKRNGQHKCRGSGPDVAKDVESEGHF